MFGINKKTKFYSLDNILANNAIYNIIIGERSNGKTYACLKYALEKFVKNREQFAYVRRWREDFRGKRGATMFDALVENNEIARLTGGAWNNVYYYSGRWYLCRYEDDGNDVKRITDAEPFAYGFSLTEMEHDKSTSYPNVTTIIFDEFLTRGYYLQDEFVLFMNTISTIVRHRKNVKIFMLGNTVNQYAPYWDEMGITNIKNMEQGKIDVYTYGDSDLRVAVEYADSPNKTKDSDVYFAFNNPKLNMITGGAWELDIYPHCPVKYKPNEVLYVYFIDFGGDLLQCEVIQHDDLLFTFIHRKTTPIKDENALIYSPEYDPRVNYRRNILKPQFGLEKRLGEHFRFGNVYYADNQVGEVVRNYLLWCKKN